MRASFENRLPGAVGIVVGFLMLVVLALVSQVTGASAQTGTATPAAKIAGRPVAEVASDALAKPANEASKSVPKTVKKASKPAARSRARRRAHGFFEPEMRPAFVVAHPASYAAAGANVKISGRLTHDGNGRGDEIRLMARVDHRWRTLSHARTKSGGRFDVVYHAGSAGTTGLRVSFKGDRRKRSTSRYVGAVTVLHPTVASWYYDAGNTACGFHATYGVANKTLPCGTKVALSYGGRTVVATVDDRGPYVSGRAYDLNQNVAHALGMYGVATVLASV